MPIWGQVELLCRAVAEEGQTEAEQMLARAKADAAEVIAAARDRADKEYQAELLARKSEAYAEAKRIVDSAELEVKKRIMALREQVTQEILQALEQRLQAFRKETPYVEFLLSALKEGFEHLPGREFVVKLNGAELGLLEDELEKLAVEGSLQIDVKASSACEGGVRITTRDGRLLYDNSFAARLKRSENEIRQEIWRVIFGAQRTPG